MAKTLLTWEAGSNLGHEMQVTSAAVLLKKEGHDVVVYAPHGVAANDAARLAGIRWEQVPETVKVPLPLGQPLWHSRATALWGFGFHSVDLIRDRLKAWDAIYQHEEPDVVALQAAPFAQVAAHVDNIRSVEFGIGFDVPPLQSPFPAFQGQQHFRPAQALRLEEAAVGNIRHVVGSAAPRGASLHSLVSGHKRLVITIPELDHYGTCDDGSRRVIGPLPLVDIQSERLKWATRKPRVLAYLRATLLDAAQMFNAFASVGSETIVICLGAEAQLIQQARKLNLKLHTAPVSIGDLLPKADLVVSHGGGGMVAVAASLGRRNLVLPNNYEQFMTGTMLHRSRLGGMANPREPQHYAFALERVLSDVEITRGTATLEQRYRGGAEFEAVAAFAHAFTA